MFGIFSQNDHVVVVDAIGRGGTGKLGNSWSAIFRGYPQMERTTKGFSSVAAHRDRMTGGKAGRCRRLDSLNPASRRVNRSLRAAEFVAFSRVVHRELNPKGPLEQLVARQAIRSAWRLKENLEGEPDLIANATPDAATDQAVRSLEVAITTLDLLQGRREDSSTPSAAIPEVGPLDEFAPSGGAIESNEWPFLPAEFDLDQATEPAGFDNAVEENEAPVWRDRLVYDFDVSDESPVVKGTWITVSRVISLIVDGATWADVLRSHPELSEEDIRMCVSYAIAEENSAI